ncbi:MAG TPA: MAB_1171c family putative transporter [Micromonospora sp.]
MDALLYALCAVFGAVAFAYLIPLALRHPTPARTAITVATGAFTVGITIANPVVADVIDRIVGLPNLARVIAHGHAIVIAASAEAMLLFLALPAAQAKPRVAWRIVVSAIAYSGMLALWLLTYAHRPDARLTVEYAHVPAVTAYLAIYLFAFVAFTVDIARMCWRFARIAGGTWLSRGLRITAVGACFGFAYCVNKALYLAGIWCDVALRGERYIAAVLVTISALLMLVGLTMPSWGPALPSVADWRRLVAYRQLYPLWRDVVAVVPGLVLDERLRKPIVALRELDYALTRRMVEIRDGWIRVRPYIDHRVIDLARKHTDRIGLTGDEREATVEAAQYAAGIRAKAAGTLAATPTTADLRNPEGGYEGELAWLTRVARAYARSPVVAATLADISAGETAADREG